MLVDAPRGSTGTILVRDRPGKVLLAEHKVSENPAAFAFPRDMGDPYQMGTFPIFLLGEAVLAIRESAVGHVHAIVPDLLGICDLVIVHSDFPVPVGPVDRLDGRFIQFQSPVK